jgi:hypothetical protein
MSDAAGGGEVAAEGSGQEGASGEKDGAAGEQG